MKSIYILFLFVCLSFKVQSQTLDTAAIQIEIDSLIVLNDKVRKEKKYDEALLIIEKAYDKCVQSFGRDNLIYARICTKKSFILYFKGEVEKFEPLAYESMDFFRHNENQIEDPAYYLSFRLLQEAFVARSQYDKAEALHLEYLDRHGRILGKDSPDYAKTINTVGKHYLHSGAKLKAKPYYLKSKELLEKLSLTNHPEYIHSLSGIASIHSDLGEYAEAEALFHEAIGIIETNEELSEHLFYIHCIDGLANIYYALGQYEKVMKYDLKALELREKTLGKNNYEYTRSLNNVGLGYQKLGQYKKAEEFLLECKELEGKLFGTSLPAYGGTLINLGTLYKEMGDHEKALSHYLEALSIFEASEKLQEHEFYLNCLTSLGNIYTVIGENDKAESYYLKDIEIRKKVMGINHYSYSTSLDNLAILYKNIKAYDKAKPLFDEANSIRKTVLLKASKHLSEDELQNLIKLFNKNQNALLSFSYLSNKLTGQIYDNSLFYKGFLLNASQRIQHLANSDTTSQNLYLKLKEYHQDLSSLYSSRVATRDTIAIARLEEAVNKTEKKLARTIAGFEDANKQVYWHDVQKTLSSGQAAIEFEYFNIFNSNGPDTVVYAAVLLLPEGEPTLIPLFKEHEIEPLLSSHQERRSDYVNDLYTIDSRGTRVVGEPKKTLFELIWKPLETHLENTNTIYFSPSGLLHRINIPAIPYDDELSLCDQYSFTQLGSTRQLVLNNKSNLNSKSAFLFGGIEYDLEVTPDFESINNSVDIDALASRGGSWNYLKYTAKEVSKIDQLLKSNNLESQVISGFDATENYFKINSQGDRSPRYLHIATHGYFFPDSYSSSDQLTAFESSDHPMIRSGLILAGGNHVWQGNEPVSGKEDGILTAYEISQMDLSNTELVVLSACETGLGDIEGNEGVYGLQRAFKIAGAKYLIMSLWQIPDRETKDFMVTFYKHLIEDKMTIPDAFRLTQKEIKERFYNPFQWAGFVLVE